MQNMDQLQAQDYHQNVTEPQVTEYHTKSTHMYNSESGLAKAQRLLQHTLQVI